MRRVTAEGGFATVLRKGDADRGSIMLAIVSRGEHNALLERVLSLDGAYRWQHVGPSESGSSAEIADFLARRARSDPDSWLIELDIANPERFIAETTAMG
jgi:hypothetical protein